MNNDDLISRKYILRLLLELLNENITIQEISEKHKVSVERVMKWQEAFENVCKLVLSDQVDDKIQHEYFDFVDEEYINTVVDNTLTVIFISDFNTNEMLYLNKSGRRILGIKNKSEYINKKCYNFFLDLDSPCKGCSRDLLREKGVIQKKVYIKKLNGHFLLTQTLAKIKDREVKVEMAIDISKDAKQIARLDNKMRINNTLLSCIRTLTEGEDINQSISELLSILCDFYHGDRGYIIEADKDFKFLNNSYEWCREGITPSIEMLQNVPFETCEEWFESFHTQGTFSISNIDENLLTENLDYKYLAAQGIESLIVAPLIEDGVIKGFIGVDNPRKEVHDLSLLTSVSSFVMNDLQKSRLYARLKKASYTDSLTKLFNRNKYFATLDKIKENPPKSVGVVFVDLNGLKITNDKIGHDFGDKLLISLANILSAVFDENVYRIGGDEFIVIYSNISKGEFENLVAEFRKQRDEQDISAALGKTWSDKNINIDILIKHTDDLMYANKQKYYHAHDKQDYNHNSSLAKKLLDNIEKGRFEVYLQPQIDLASGEICGAEALIRAYDIYNNIVGPDNFIPEYEASGIIRHIDFFVFETICKLIRDLENQDKCLENISVIFSRITLLEYDVVKQMVRLCKKHSVLPSKITIEITETTSKLNMDEIVSLVKEIKNAGFKVSLDDYGSKYSNMSVLLNIGFDEIKLDRSIISEVTKNKKNQTIIEYTIKMLKHLNSTKVIAEGIETAQEFEFVKKFGCDYGQGYRFSKPIPISDFLEKYL